MGSRHVSIIVWLVMDEEDEDKEDSWMVGLEYLRLIISHIRLFRSEDSLHVGLVNYWILSN